MAMTSRENVWAALKFQGPEWLPRQTWFLPWAEKNLPDILEEINRRFPSDFRWVGGVYQPSARVKGDAYAIGSATDDWGCTFVNIQDGVHGEVKEPIVADLAAWPDVVQPPYEVLPADPDAARDAVNRACAETDLFTFAGCNPRPWERYQFLRGTENAMIDVMFPEEGARAMLARIHAYYLREVEFWVSTDVDCISFMDDWGSQTALLIPPRVWRDLFKPLYREYCALAHAHGKAAFMHSDGCIQEIYPDLVEVGVDALNSQLFTMDMAELARVAKGKLTFWGEMDRQHVLPALNPQVGRDAVRRVAAHLYDPRGGIIAQFELSPGSHGPTALAVHDEWTRVFAEGLA